MGRQYLLLTFPFAPGTNGPKNSATDNLIRLFSMSSLSSHAKSWLSENAYKPDETTMRMRRAQSRLFAGFMRGV